MAYIPSSKVSFLTTPGGELLYKSTQKEYTGDYIETSEGKYYVGKSLSTLGPELILPFNTTVNFGTGKDFHEYKKLNPTTYNRIKKTKEVPTTKNTPDKKDYEKGHYIRYFIQKLNENHSYQEVDRKTHSAIVNRSDQYDHNLYKGGFIKWTLRGGNVKRTNTLTLKRKEKEFIY